MSATRKRKATDEIDSDAPYKSHKADLSLPVADSSPTSPPATVTEPSVPSSRRPAAWAGAFAAAIVEQQGLGALGVGSAEESVVERARNSYVDDRFDKHRSIQAAWTPYASMRADPSFSAPVASPHLPAHLQSTLARRHLPPPTPAATVYPDTSLQYPSACAYCGYISTSGCCCAAAASGYHGSSSSNGQHLAMGGGRAIARAPEELSAWYPPPSSNGLFTFAANLRIRLSAITGGHAAAQASSGPGPGPAPAADVSKPPASYSSPAAQSPTNTATALSSLAAYSADDDEEEEEQQ